MSIELAPDKPLVLCLSGHDPGGGAGIHADIESVAANGGHALTIITALTVQDTHNVSRVVAVAPMLIAQQLEALLTDCSISAVKIGLIGDAEQVPVIASAVARLRLPLVLDPVLQAGGGSPLSSARTVAALREQLFPLATVLTPNAAEARRLAAGADTLAACAQALLATGCANVLITGGDEPGEAVVNTWHRADAAPQAFRWPRLPETFHGAGCTLAAALAARLACGDSIAEALRLAQSYTYSALQCALRTGRGRRIPGRRR
ncbi:MAG: bifunctional hydroxymethylpyrimidine kinase/phosphomethylpyrimidine kinase [Stenotrophobium sp.]